MKEDGDGAKTKEEQIRDLRNVILFFYIKNKHSGRPGIGLKKRDIKKAIEDKCPELKKYMHYFEDAFEILAPPKGGIPSYLKKIKGYSYGLKEEIASSIIQDYRLADFFVKLVERFDDKSFSFKKLKENFPNNRNLEKLLGKLKKMEYVADDSFEGDDNYLIVLDKYNEDKYLFELIIREKIRKIR